MLHTPIDILTNTLAFGLPGHGEWLVLLVLGLLIFGRKLPEVGRWLGQSIVEFKRGIKGIQTDIDDESGKATPALSKDQHASLSAQPEQPRVAQPAEPAAAKTSDHS